jgi:hypothetical protein
MGTQVAPIAPSRSRMTIHCRSYIIINHLFILIVILPAKCGQAQKPQALTTFSQLNNILCKYHIKRVIGPAWNGQFTPAETGQWDRIFHHMLRSEYLYILNITRLYKLNIVHLHILNIIPRLKII